MKCTFYVGTIGLVRLEAANVYFIMPMPGSQRLATIDQAYFLYTHRWAVRALAILLMLVGCWPAYLVRRWWTTGLLIILLAISYAFNFWIAPDQMFA